MANYTTHFSAVIVMADAAQVAAAVAVYDKFVEASEEPIDFDCGPMPGENSQLWIRDSDDGGTPEHVVGYIALLAAEVQLTGLWGFQYADTCSSHRIDAFGGGAAVLDLATGELLQSVNSNEWMQKLLAPGAPAPLIDWRAHAEKLAAEISNCTQQIEQMKGMFNDDDGEIQKALEDADTALEIFDKAKRRAPTEPQPVAVILEGGLVQGVVSRDPAMIGRSFMVIDYDTEGADADDLVSVDQGDGTSQMAFKPMAQTVGTTSIVLPETR